MKKRLCIRCGECAAACPVEAVYLDNTGDPFVCIHCGRCVDFCPHACLEMRALKDNSPVGDGKEATP